jgi:predicted RND superfamily exporter protein
VLFTGTVYFGAWIARLEINAETDAFMEQEDPGLKVYYETRDEWGWDEYVVVCVTADNWFTGEGIRRLRDIEADLKAVPGVSSTMSVFEVPLLRQHPGKKPNLLLVRRAIKYLGDEDADLEAARTELMTHGLAAGNLISENGRSLNFLVYLSDDQFDGVFNPVVIQRRHAMVRGIREVAEKWQRTLDEPVHLSGIPLINVTLFENVRHDLVVFGGASLALFSLALLLFFRRARFVFIPIICCLMPVALILGAMALFNVPIALVTSNMPVLLFVLMLPYNIYFVERYRERRRRRPGEDGLTSTLSALQTIMVPCLFSCATTLAGFAALGTSRILPIRDFGRLMAIGMAIGVCVVFLFIPAAMRKLRALNYERNADEDDGIRPARGLVRIFQGIALARPALVVVLSIAVLVVSGLGARQISADAKFTSYFWPESEVYKGLEFIDQEMGGTTWIEVILSSGEKNFFRKQEGLEALALVESYFKTIPETGNILSLKILRDEVRKTFSPQWFPLLSDSAIFRIIGLVAPEVLLQVSRPGFATVRSTVRMKETSPSLERNRIINGLHRHIASNAAALGDLDVKVTGVFPIYADLLNTLLEGQKRSLFIVPLAVYLMLLLLFRSPVLALLVLIPQALPVTVLLGMMGWFGIPLDLVTVMIASIAIGVGIDAAIQYTVRFRAELDSCGDHRDALRRAHGSIGQAIWIATSIIVVGFSILVLSEFFPSVWFGLFTALAMVISQLATLTLLPSLFLITGYPRLKPVSGANEKPAGAG